MKILDIEIRGFRSFKEPQQLHIGKMRPGLYLVSGPNGAGKSSLFDAIAWTAFDKTSRGLRAGSVKSWTGKEACAGVLATQVPSGQLSVLRIWKPNTLEVSLDDGEAHTVEQSEVDRLLGMSLDRFLFSMYFAQFSTPFIDLKPAEQMEVFSSVLELQLWEEAAAQATFRTSSNSGAVAVLRQEDARLRGQAEELLRQLQSVDESRAAWDKERAALLTSLEKGLAGARRNTQEACAAAAKHETGASDFKARRAKVEAAAATCAATGGEARAVEKELRELRGKAVRVCPTCGQKLGKDGIEHVASEVKKKEAELAKLTERGEREMEKHDEAMRHMVKVRESEVAWNKAMTVVGGRAATEKALEGSLKDCRAERNPFAGSREELEKRGEALAEKVGQNDEALKKAEVELAATQYWAKGFKEIRLALVRDALPQLTVEANETLFALGLQDWAIEFDVERETKSGTIAKGFTVMIRAPRAPEAVPFESWSGGESQRLRIALTLGLANLITSRLGVAPNLEMWDEPTNHLNEDGIQRLLEVLAERAQRMQKVILLADHRSLDFGGFAGEIRVEKTPRGSVLSRG